MQICLFQAKILMIHSLMCDCPLCKPNPEERVSVFVHSSLACLRNNNSEHVFHPQENQRNDDECWVCKRREDQLVECDECPRSFHQKCHIPHIEDAVCRWVLVQSGDRSSSDKFGYRTFLVTEQKGSVRREKSGVGGLNNDACWCAWKPYLRLSKCARVRRWFLTDFLSVVFVSRDSGQWLCTFCVFKTNQEYFYRHEQSREEAMSCDMAQHRLVRELRHTLFFNLHSLAHLSSRSPLCPIPRSVSIFSCVCALMRNTWLLQAPAPLWVFVFFF